MKTFLIILLMIIKSKSDEIINYKLTITFKDYADQISSLSQSPDGTMISGSYDKTVRIWDLQSNSNISTFKINSYVSSISGLQDGKIAIGALDQTVRILNPSTKTFQTIFSEPIYYGSTILQLQDGRIAVGSIDQKILIWNLKNNQLDLTLTGHTNTITSLIQLQDGTLISGSYDKSIKIWNLKSNTFQYSLSGHSDTISFLLLLRDGRIASASYDKTILIWNLKTRTKEGTLLGHSDRVTSIIQLLDDKIASASFDKTINIWNLKSYTIELTINAHSDNINCLLLLKDGRFASGSSDKTIKLWQQAKCSSTIDFCSIQIFNVDNNTCFCSVCQTNYQYYNNKCISKITTGTNSVGSTAGTTIAQNPIISSGDTWTLGSIYSTGSYTGSSNGSNTGSSSGSSSGSNSGNSSGSNTGSNTGSGSGGSSGSTTGSYTGSSSGSSSGSSNGNSSGSNAGNSSGSNTGSNTGSGGSSGSSTGKNTGSSLGGSSGSSTGSNTGSSSVNSSGSGTGSNTGSNSVNSSGSSTGSYSGSVISSNNSTNVDSDPFSVLCKNKNINNCLENKIYYDNYLQTCICNECKQGYINSIFNCISNDRSNNTDICYSQDKYSNDTTKYICMEKLLGFNQIYSNTCSGTINNNINKIPNGKYFIFYHQNFSNFMYLGWKDYEITLQYSKCLGDYLGNYYTLLYYSPSCTQLDIEGFYDFSSLNDLDDSRNIMKSFLGDFLEFIVDNCSKIIPFHNSKNMKSVCKSSHNIFLDYVSSICKSLRSSEYYNSYYGKYYTCPDSNCYKCGYPYFYTQEANDCYYSLLDDIRARNDWRVALSALSGLFSPGILILLVLHIRLNYFKNKQNETILYFLNVQISCLDFFLNMAFFLTTLYNPIELLTMNAFFISLQFFSYIIKGILIIRNNAKPNVQINCLKVIFPILFYFGSLFNLFGSPNNFLLETKLVNKISSLNLSDEKIRKQFKIDLKILELIFISGQIISKIIVASVSNYWHGVQVLSLCGSMVHLFIGIHTIKSLRIDFPDVVENNQSKKVDFVNNDIIKINQDNILMNVETNKNDDYQNINIKNEH